MKQLIIATRKSALALWQSEHIKSKIEDKFPELEVKLKTFVTKGDKILDTPLALIGGKGLFIKELEHAMLKNEAHIAVHSLKDLPTKFEHGLKLAAVTTRENTQDILLSQKYDSIDSLPENAVVGTSSLRRKMQLLKYRDDLSIKELRGNVNTRINKMKNGEFSDEPRVPTEYLRSLFGDSVDEALITLDYEMERKQDGKESRLMDLLIAKEWKSLFKIPDVKIY
jgi:hydroxymethylbilane synthase